MSSSRVITGFGGTMGRWWNYVWNHLGHCPWCMRKAFWASITSWVVTIGTYALPSPPMMHDVVITLSAALTALWLTHILVYARKQSISSPFRVEDSLTRRTVLPIFTRAIAAAALSAALPVPAFALTCDSAHGWYPCQGHCGNVCYNPAKGDTCSQGVVCGGPNGSQPCKCGCYVPAKGEICHS